MLSVGVCIMPNKLNTRYAQGLIRRLSRKFQLVIFNPDLILHEPVESWPRLNTLITFYHTTLPFDKVVKYYKMYGVRTPNDLLMQYALFDRRVTMTILQSLSINTPRCLFVNRTEFSLPFGLIDDIESCFNIKLKFPLNEVEEIDENTIRIDGKIMKKPFVEKPVSSEDHNIYVYYPNGGGVRKLFRKQNNRSSELDMTIKTIRRNGSYIYEELLNGDGLDIKVYGLGCIKVYAETRKSPTVDGIVDRDEAGRERRTKIELRDYEREYAFKISAALKQLICGFDMIRVGDQSYVIDVNGWSFVKNDESYYDDCSIVLCNFIDKEKIDGIVRIYRHADRTPKEKMKIRILKEGNKSEEELIDELLNNQLSINKEVKSYKKQIKTTETYVELVLKRGGELTDLGKIQCIRGGRILKDELCDDELLKRLNVYSSNENRVKDSAKYFGEALTGHPITIVEDRPLLGDNSKAINIFDINKENLKEIIFDEEEVIRNFVKKLGNGIVTNKLEFNERWKKLAEKMINSQRLSHSNISELYDNLRYDLVHLREDLMVHFPSIRIFYNLLKKYIFIIRSIEYGLTNKSIMDTGLIVVEDLLKQIFDDIETGKTNIYFTKESKMRNLWNVIFLVFKSEIEINNYKNKICNNGDNGLIPILDFGYMSYISFKRIGSIIIISINCGATGYEDEHLLPDEILSFKVTKEKMKLRLENLFIK
ncbi:Inositol hexakisphosphate and diphosphoinositol-pentakisphosphate kinase [Astathelohania contejeani]|uniref:Inositol hexakisphosphate and diphosphoinositol-pentakisphosphate kinase n=1 Tax=Astathelohania contejeani TaxID=164912 RepID=A0ABQ7HYD6_9MICR|nr:Inositol hexakisphosphate and diphosphoinositol-pentakisphosphate kinase [Thelohania contejeani]